MKLFIAFLFLKKVFGKQVSKINLFLQVIKFGTIPELIQVSNKNLSYYREGVLISEGLLRS